MQTLGPLPRSIFLSDLIVPLLVTSLKDGSTVSSEDGLFLCDGNGDSNCGDDISNLGDGVLK